MILTIITFIIFKRVDLMIPSRYISELPFIVLMNRSNSLDYVSSHPLYHIFKMCNAVSVHHKQVVSNRDWRDRSHIRLPYLSRLPRRSVSIINI